MITFIQMEEEHFIIFILISFHSADALFTLWKRAFILNLNARKFSLYIRRFNN